MKTNLLLAVENIIASAIATASQLHTSQKQAYEMCRQWAKKHKIWVSIQKAKKKFSTKK